jgi:hypothetical protein
MRDAAAPSSIRKSVTCYIRVPISDSFEVEHLRQRQKQIPAGASWQHPQYDHLSNVRQALRRSICTAAGHQTSTEAHNVSRFDGHFPQTELS